MKSRLDLQTLLEQLLGSRNVYFQPPESTKMNYPAIVYSRQSIDNRHANDSIYTQNVSYKVTVIDKDPDSEIVMKVSQLPMCSHVQHFTSDNLNHDVFTLYY